MHKILYYTRKTLIRLFIRHGILRNIRVSIKDRSIAFDELHGSNLLKMIAVDGYRAHEDEVVRLIEKYPWTIDKFIDAGANIGFYSILASIFFNKDVKVIAVEPFPDNIRYIKKVMKKNNLNFDLIERALDGESDKELSMFYPIGKGSSKLASSASLINSFKGTKGIFSNLPYKTIPVRTVTLPQVIGDGDSRTLVKLDCEGNELKILKSSRILLERGNVDYIIEMCINDSDKHELYRLMADSGYDAYLISNAGFIKEDRPLTLPYPNIKNRTIWKNHFFTKKEPNLIKKASLDIYGYYV